MMTRDFWIDNHRMDLNTGELPLKPTKEDLSPVGMWEEGGVVEVVRLILLVVVLVWLLEGGVVEEGVVEEGVVVEGVVEEGVVDGGVEGGVTAEGALVSCLTLGDRVGATVDDARKSPITRPAESLLAGESLASLAPVLAVTRPSVLPSPPLTVDSSSCSTPSSSSLRPSSLTPPPSVMFSILN